MNREECFSWLNQHKEMVISSVNAEGNSESAAVGFGQTPDLQLVFGTSSKSRKSKNIKNNERVSAVVGWDHRGTIQYEGTARALSEEEVRQYTSQYFEKSPEAAQYKDLPDQQYIVVTPTWIQYTDVTTQPWTIVEIVK